MRHSFTTLCRSSEVLYLVLLVSCNSQHVFVCHKIAPWWSGLLAKALGAAHVCAHFKSCWSAPRKGSLRLLLPKLLHAEAVGFWGAGREPCAAEHWGHGLHVSLSSTQQPKQQQEHLSLVCLVPCTRLPHHPPPPWYRPSASPRPPHTPRCPPASLATPHARAVGNVIGPSRARCCRGSRGRPPPAGGLPVS